MGRRRVGSRKIHGPVGQWYAICRHTDGKTLRESLGTRDHSKAMRLWPTAFLRLKDRANGVKPEWIPPAPDEFAVIGEHQPDGLFIERETTAAEIYSL